MQISNGRVYEMSLYEVKNDLITPFRLIDSRYISYRKVLTRSLEDCKSDNNLTLFSRDNQNRS